MSWLTDLAGKAENMLNKLDQNAGTVLHHKSNPEEENLIEVKTESSNDYLIETTKKNILSLTRPVTPLQKLKPVLNSSSDFSSDFSDKQSDKQSVSSRPSSINSSRNENSVIEREIHSITKPALDLNELTAIKIVLAEIKSERDELKTELENLTEQIKRTNNKSRIKELEDMCTLLVSEKDELFDKNSILEEANSKYVKSISELETSISKLHQSEIELTEKLKWGKTETDQAITDLQAYRSRAQTTLLLKEKMIEQLKVGDQKMNSTGNELISLELEELRLEKNNLTDEIGSLKDQLEQTKHYSVGFEEKYKKINEGLELSYQKMQEDLLKEQRRCQRLEDELKIQNQELGSVREEMVRFRTSTSMKIHEKETELSRLRSKIVQRSENSLSNDMEDRIQSLTQSLVQKQTSLETSTAERNALKLQLEKLDNQHRMMVIQYRQSRPQIINVNDTDDAKAKVPNFFQETPFDNKVARRVKRAYSSLDSLGVRLGVFLRRYPLIRILVIFYVGILHLWVLIVLLSSTPN